MSRDQRIRSDGHRRQRELLPGTPRTRRHALIGVVFLYEARDPDSFAQAYGPSGEWAQFFAGARGYLGSELLRDVDQPGRYLLIDRWESTATYNDFVEANQAEYMRRSDETSFHYVQELRFGTFESTS
jgi:heme-degrading monooxygenase HmoA